MQITQRGLCFDNNGLVILMKKMTLVFCQSAKLFGISMLVAMPHLAIGQSNLQRQRVEKMSALKVLCGNWQLNSRMIPLNWPEIPETGTMNCRSIYDSTYLECDVSLTNTSGRKRGYREFITYNTDSLRYEALYLYSGTAMRVLEFGRMTDEGLVTVAMLNLTGSRIETIDAILKIRNKDELYYESRSSET